MTTSAVQEQSERMVESDVFEAERPEVNVGGRERIAMGLFGGILAARALSHPTLPRLLAGLLGGGLVYRSISGHCPAYERLGINNAIPGAATPHDYFMHGIHVEMAYMVMKPARQLYDFWRNFENLPRFMTHLKSVTVTSERTSRWVVAGPAGRLVSWDAEIINEEPGRFIAWRSLENADVHNAGSVWFTAHGERGTEVRVSIEYIPPAGKLGKAIAFLFGEEPRQQIQEDLRSFKRLMETGEIPTTQGQPRGRCGAR